MGNHLQSPLPMAENSGHPEACTPLPGPPPEIVGGVESGTATVTMEVVPFKSITAAVDDMRVGLAYTTVNYAGASPRASKI